MALANIKLICYTCHNTLRMTIQVPQPQLLEGAPFILHIDPCACCLENEWDKGYDTGKKEPH